MIVSVQTRNHVRSFLSKLCKLISDKCNGKVDAVPKGTDSGTITVRPVAVSSIAVCPCINRYHKQILSYHCFSPHRFTLGPNHKTPFCCGGLSPQPLFGYPSTVETIYPEQGPAWLKQAPWRAEWDRTLWPTLVSIQENLPCTSLPSAPPPPRGDAILLPGEPALIKELASCSHPLPPPASPCPVYCETRRFASDKVITTLPGSQW
jgi:hypothetical protein